MVALDARQSPAATAQPEGSVAGRGDWLAVLRILLIVQGAIALVSTIEGSIAAVSQGGVTLPLSFVGLVGAAVTLALAARIGRGSRRVRRVVVLFQVGWLVAAAIDLTLALVITQRPLELVPLLTRVALPLAIVSMLRSPDARQLFGVGPSRRQRRKARNAQRLEGRLG